MAELHDLAAPYALDALDADERAAFEAHLATCEACRSEIAEHADAVAALAAGDAVPPPADLRERVLASIADIEQDRAPLRSVPGGAAGRRTERSTSTSTARRSARPRRPAIAGLLAAAAAVAAIVVGAVVVIGGRSGDTGFDTVADADDAVVLELTGDAGTLDVAYSAALDQVALRGDGVDDLSDDQRYALWAIADGTPVLAGLFAEDDGSIDDVVEFADVDAQQWGITIESAAGAEAPTGDILYLADV